MRKFIAGIVVGAFVMGAAAFADQTALQTDVNNRIQAEMGSLMTTVMTLQGQLAAAQSAQSACEQKLKDHKIK